jgi:PKHD-type hydroxylase
MTEARRIREKLGVDQNVMLAPQAPQPNIIEGNQMDCLTHQGIFTPGDCAKLIADNSSKEWEEAGMNKKMGNPEKHVDHQWRHTENIWLERNEANMWAFDKMLALVMSANQNKYQYEIDFFEALQLAKYEENMHYNWHADLGPGVMGNRKLSVTVQLSSPDDYEGGELLLDVQAIEPFVAPKEIGSVTVFPSFLKHKVTPVTKGTRYSLVAWASGTQRFR